MLAFGGEPGLDAVYGFPRAIGNWYPDLVSTLTAQFGPAIYNYYYGFFHANAEVLGL